MFTRHVGAVQPVWAPEDGGAAAAADAAAAAAASDPNGKPNAGDNGSKGDQNGSVAFDPGKAFEGLEADNLTWLQKAGLDKDPKALAKQAFNQEKLIGNSIRVPGKDATPEERDAFLNKLGRPEKVDGYAFTAPKDMPEGLPYDGERANAFKGKAHELGLTNDQAAKLHDWFIGDQVEAFKGMGAAQAEAMTQKANTATETLVKEWGPLDGERAAANFEIADQVFQKAPGGPEVLAELKELGLVGPNKEILSAPLAKLFASLGTALYTEDGVLRGKPDVIGNPFVDGDNFNMTEQMRLVKTDPDRARSLITAAGKKLDEFGLK